MAKEVESPFDMDVTREQALFLLAAGLAETDCWCLMSKEYGDDDDWCGVTDEDFDTIRDGPEYQTFALWFTRSTLEGRWKKDDEMKRIAR